MAVSQQQKVDFLLKKLGFTKTKTGLAVDSTLTGTKKAGFAEAIPSPLIIANSSVWNEADSIPATPPGSDTNQVKVYLAASSGHRMTVDSTVANNRAFIAFSTYNDTSSTRLNNWIDTQFGAGYLIKVFKGDPNSGGVQLSAAGSGANDGWFFDYSAGVLNFNDTNVPSGVTGTNIYIVGYRYIGQTGAPTSGISTFSFFDLSVERNLDVGVQGGISTFRNNIDANGIIEGIAGQNKIPFLYSDMSDLPSAGTYHGMFAHVHATGRGYFAHAGGWHELVNVETNGNVGTGTQRYLLGSLVSTSTTAVSLNVTGISTFGGNLDINADIDVDGHTNLDNVSIAGFTTITQDLNVDGHTNLDNVSVAGVSTFSDTVKVGTGVTALTNGNVSIGGTFEIFESSGIANRNFSQFKLSNFSISQFQNTGSYFIKNSSTGQLLIGGGIGGNGGIGLYNNVLNAKYLRTHSEGSVEIFHDNTVRFETSGIGATVYGQLDTTDLDVDGHTELDDLNVSGIGTIGSGSSGFAELQYQGVKKLETTTNGVTISGNLFTGNINASHDGNTSISLQDTGHGFPASEVKLSNGGRDLNIVAPKDIRFFTQSNENAIVLEANAQVELYFNGSEKARTSSTGFDVTGNVVSDGLVVDGNSDLNGDLDVDGHTNLDNVSISGVTSVASLTSGRVVLAGTGGKLEDSNKLTFDGTTLGLTGNANFTGNLTVGGVLTYEDVKNVDAVGLITARSGIRVTSGVIEAQAGENKIPSLYSAMGNLPSAGSYHGMFAHVHATGRGYFAHAGNWLELVNKEINGVVGTGTETYNIGNLVSTSSTTTSLNVVGVATFGGNVDVNGNIFDADGHVNLDNVSIAGVTTATGLVGFGTHVTLQDGAQIRLGEKVSGGNRVGDLIISHDTSMFGDTYNRIDSTNGNMWIVNRDTVKKYMYIRSNDIQLRDWSNNLAYIHCKTNSEVELYYNGSQKLETTNTGIDVTGNVVSDGLVVDGNFDLNGDIDVDGHTNLDNVSIAGVTTMSGNLTISNSLPQVYLQDTDHNSDYAIWNHHGVFRIVDATNANATRLSILSDGTTTINQNLNVGNGVDITGLLTVSGDSDLNGDLDVDGHTNLDNLSVAGVSTFSDTVKVGTGITALTNGNVSIGGTLELFNTTGNANSNPSEIKLSNLTIAQHQNTGTYKFQNNHSTGSLLLSAGGSGYGGLAFWNSNFTRQYLTARDQGSVKLFHNNTVRFETSGIGATVYGQLDTTDLDVDGHTNLDNVSIAGFTTITQDLNVDGHTNLDNVSISGVTTTTDDINIDADNKKLQIGDSQDLILRHDGHHSFVHTKTGNLSLSSVQKVQLSKASGEGSGDYEKMLEANVNGSVDLYFDNNLKFKTTNQGIEVTGHSELDNVNIVGVTTTNNHINIDADNKKLQIGDSQDLKLRHDGSHSFVHTETGNLSLSSQNKVQLSKASGDGSANYEYMVQAFADGAVELYYDNVLKFATTNTGINVTGNVVSDGLVVDGNFDLNGDIDVDGHTNLDNVSIAGVTTFSSNLDANGDLDVDGHTNLDNVSVVGVTTFTGTTEFDSNAKFDSTITAGGATGTNGQYLKSTGSGVAWASFPTLRTRQTFTASAGQTTFSFSYNVNFVDVFVNGIKLTDAEFTATNGSSVVLAVGCFVGDIVELVSYNIISGGGGGGGGSLNNIVEDTTPQLGGNLDLFNKSITGTGNVNITGIISATTFKGPSGVTATFVGDGSGLTGITASGSGVVVKDNNNAVGTAGTINFGNNLSVSAASAGIVTVTGLSGITTINGVASIANDLDVDGHTNLDNVSIAGVTTFSSNLDVNADIDVDGHANLDNVSIAGVTTFAGAIDANSNLDVDGHTNLDNVSIAGVSTFSDDVKLPDDTFVRLGDLATGDFTINHDGARTMARQHGAGSFILDLLTSSNSFNITKANLSETIAKFIPDGAVELYHNNVKRFETSSVGVSIPQDLDVDGHTNLDNVNIAGVVTATTFKGALEATSASFSSNIDANGNLDVAGTATLGSGGSGQAILEYQGTTRLKTEVDRIDTFGHLNVGGNVDNALLRLGQSNDLVLTHDGDQSFINNLTSNLNINAPTVVVGTGLSVGGISTFTGAVYANGDLYVDGHTNLDNVSVVGMVTVTNAASGTALKLIDSSNKQFVAGGGGGGSPFVGSGTNHDFRIQVGGTQNAIFKYAAGATGNLELGPSSGIGITFNGSTGNAGYAGIITATKFVGDGSGLTGVTASGSGVVVKNSGSTVGTAGTINFGDNLSVSAISGGSVTITATDTQLSTEEVQDIVGAMFSGNTETNISATYQDSDGTIDLVATGSYANSDVDSHLNVSGASSGQILSWNGSDYAWVADQTGGGSGISTISGVVNIANDLDVDGHTNLDNVSIAGVTTITSSSLHPLQISSSSAAKIKLSGSNNAVIQFQEGTTDKTFLAWDSSGMFYIKNQETNKEIRLGNSLKYVQGGTEYKVWNETNDGSGSTLDADLLDGQEGSYYSPNVGITTNLSGTFTASAGSPSTINTFGYGSGDIVVEYTVFIKNGSDFQSQKLLAMRDGTTIHSTQFAVMYSSSLLVQLDATISSGNILLRATPETGVSGSTTYKVKREVM